MQVQREAPLSPGAFLWRPGLSFQGLAIVRSGCVKLYEESANGEERVLQFAFAGDLLGLEALASQKYESHAVALGEVLICRLETPTGSGDHAVDARFYQRLLQQASRILQQRMRLSRSGNPAVALLAFLELLAERIGRPVESNGRRHCDIQLPMSRLEMGAYLGYAEETVCRTLLRLQQQGRLQVRGRRILMEITPRSRAVAASTEPR
jgi:CRP/FNR family transcriptional regulator